MISLWLLIITRNEVQDCRIPDADECIIFTKLFETELEAVNTGQKYLRDHPDNNEYVWNYCIREHKIYIV